MKPAIYDDANFFAAYRQMNRSVQGLAGAGEWETLQGLLPDFKNKAVLDLGCGFGWHCQYALEHGAASVLGVDNSEKMLGVARETTDKTIQYLHSPMETLDLPANRFDIVLSSLAFHYLASFDDMARKVAGWLTAGGDFIFSVEHPVFTAEGSQDWVRDTQGQIQHFPLDRYFDEGERQTNFLGSAVTKYHRTLTSYLGALLRNGFNLQAVVEPQPSEVLQASVAGMRDELRRPMMLIVAAHKPA